MSIISRGLESELDEQIRATPGIVWQTVRETFVEVLGEDGLDDWLESNKLGEMSGHWGWREVVDYKRQVDGGIVGVKSLRAIADWTGPHPYDLDEPLELLGKDKEFSRALGQKELAHIDVDLILLVGTRVMLRSEVWPTIHRNLDEVCGLLAAMVTPQAANCWFVEQTMKLREQLGLPVIAEGPVEDDDGLLP
ncbi:hypothetical protein COT78_01650 [Candidatus Berkelbacteria bacterium CG10_big_fil_rev_8_21_14_0_10_43_13]|uniref:Uncharacterized protein n=1 Tax=Candidatus Berkelbacteria bacterium CG10_big_fil_rev_8_21_14_0_10_43_13 TaxID=1974514 RepID=A0A2H0W8U8_9BACT|nr:MAG: hypothetical protein COT78_01650 [Candidatus Berkelbacteria bacterium CG10_big_fil_rev_8_21_14_0_10_43_13]